MNLQVGDEVEFQILGDGLPRWSDSYDRLSSSRRCRWISTIIKNVSNTYYEVETPLFRWYFRTGDFSEREGWIRKPCDDDDDDFEWE